MAGGKTNASEFQLQKAVAEYLALTLPPFVCFSSIGHGGGGKVRGAMLKASGLKSGVPDIFILHQGRAYFIELKAKGGVVSPAQKGFHERIRTAGAKVEVCRSLYEVQRFLLAYDIPIKIEAGGMSPLAEAREQAEEARESVERNRMQRNGFTRFAQRRYVKAVAEVLRQELGREA